MGSSSTMTEMWMMESEVNCPKCMEQSLAQRMEWQAMTSTTSLRFFFQGGCYQQGH